MKFSVLAAVVAVFAVGAASPATAQEVEPTGTLTGQHYIKVKQAPVGGAVPILARYRTNPVVEVLCDTDFGDGQVGTGPCETQHAYTEPGTYEVVQTARTATGLTATSRASIVVVPDVGPLSVTATPVPLGSLEVELRLAIVSGWDVPHAVIDWGDDRGTSGPADQLQYHTHTYWEPGTYVIGVRLQDSNGTVATTTTTVDVT